VNSILTRLLAWQIGTLIVTAAFITALTYQLTWSQFSRDRDRSLEQVAWAVMRHHGMHPEIYDLSERQQSIISQVWNDKGELIFASRPDLPMPLQKPGRNTFTWQDEEWHAMVVSDRGITVQVGNQANARSLWFREFGTSLIVPFAVLVLIMGSFIAIAATQAFQPLRQLRKEIQQRNPEFLSPLSRSQYPDEMLVIVDALNDMLTRLDQALLARQRFIADAAHELRTPLTAVQLNADIALGEPEGRTRNEALNNLRRGVERATHLANQLLHLARFDPQFAAKNRLSTVDLAELAKTEIIEHDIFAANKQLDLGLAVSGDASLDGDREALRIALSNLIDNAIRYTPNKGCIDVSISSSPEWVELNVIDNGPGIPAGERERVFEPFCRLSSIIPGSGLGLAITREIIRQHHGRITLDDSPGGGLNVHVALPRKLP
jgi:signal transduction histidine kinase